MSSGDLAALIVTKREEEKKSKLEAEKLQEEALKNEKLPYRDEKLAAKVLSPPFFSLSLSSLLTSILIRVGMHYKQKHSHIITLS